MRKKLVVAFLLVFAIFCIGTFNDTAYASDANKYQVLSPSKSSFSITDKVYLINGKAPTGTDVTIEVYGTTDLTKKNFNLNHLPSKDDYIRLSSETVTSGNMGFFQKQINLILGINKVVVSFDAEGVADQEFIIYVYNKSIINNDRFGGFSKLKK